VLRQELFPGRPAAALRRGFDAIALQDVGNSASRQVMSEIRQRTNDPGVPPVAILGGHLDYERFDLVIRPWSAGPAAGGSIVFPGDQLPVPGQESLRRDDRCHRRQNAMAEPFALTAS
jgi:hypothetical protein